MSTQIEGYNKDTLLEMLHCRVVEIKFHKADDELRVLRGTLKEDLIPPKKKSDHRDIPNLVTLWDVDAKDWRSIRTDRIIEVL